MSDRPGINLLPEEGREVENKRERNHLLTLAALAIVVLVGGLTIVAFTYGAYLEKRNIDANDSIAASNQKLSALKPVEILYRTVGNKLIKLQDVLAHYPHDSVVLDDIASLTPTGVSLSSLTFDTSNKVSVSGKAVSPSQFGDFVTILKDPKTGGTKFTSVEIISVSGGGKQGNYTFTLSMVRKEGF